MYPIIARKNVKAGKYIIELKQPANELLLFPQRVFHIRFYVIKAFYCGRFMESFYIEPKSSVYYNIAIF